MHTNAGPCHFGYGRSCSVNGCNSGSQAADGVRRERLSCKIAERGAESGVEKRCVDTEEDEEVRERVSVSNTEIKAVHVHPHNTFLNVSSNNET